MQTSMSCFRTSLDSDIGIISLSGAGKSFNAGKEFFLILSGTRLSFLAMDYKDHVLIGGCGYGSNVMLTCQKGSGHY